MITWSAKYPSTTLGIPASVSRIGFSRRRVLGLAYSDRYIAAPRPSGAAITMAITETSTVPIRIVGMSNSPSRGNHPIVQS